MDLRLGYDVFNAVVADLREAVDTLDDSRRRAAGDVGALLDGGWTGAAAGSFGTAWEQWLVGAEQVRAALTSIITSLETIRSGLTSTDGAAAADARSLLERLG